MKETISKKQLREFGLLIGFGFPILIGWLLPALFGHELPVDDRVRPALHSEARTPDRRVDGVRGRLLVVEVADRARLAVRVPVARRPPPNHPPGT